MAKVPAVQSNDSPVMFDFASQHLDKRAFARPRPANEEYKFASLNRETDSPQSVNEFGVPNFDAFKLNIGWVHRWAIFLNFDDGRQHHRALLRPLMDEAAHGIGRLMHHLIDVSQVARGKVAEGLDEMIEYRLHQSLWTK